jgi:DNA-binding transcriptional regulator YiaG
MAPYWQIQYRFAALIGVSGASVAAWEQGRRQPSRLARKMLALMDRNPSMFIEEFERSRR